MELKEAFSKAPDSVLGRYLNAYAGVLWLSGRGDAHHRWAERRRGILRLRVANENREARFFGGSVAALRSK
jgi:hypothetical protein